MLTPNTAKPRTIFDIGDGQGKAAITSAPNTIWTITNFILIETPKPWLTLLISNNDSLVL